MAQVIVRQLEESVKAALKARAQHHGRSMEEEARQILIRALGAAPATSGLEEPKAGLGTRIAARYAGVGFDSPPEELNWQMKPARLGNRSR